MMKTKKKRESRLYDNLICNQYAILRYSIIFIFRSIKIMIFMIKMMIMMIARLDYKTGFI